MLAPIDATATVQADEDVFTLCLNMRTLALAKAGGVNLLKLSLTDIDPLDMAVVIQAFAKPQHPEFTDEQAFALIVRYPAQCRDALAALSSEFATAAGDGPKNPPKPVRRKASTTS
jgi:hypothetical protein